MPKLLGMAKKRKRTGPIPAWSMRIAACRTLLGGSQEVIAQQIGVSQQSYSQYETGEAEPNIRTWINLSSVFDRSIDFLMKGAPPSGGDGQSPMGSRDISEIHQQNKVKFGPSI